MNKPMRGLKLLLGAALGLGVFAGASSASANLVSNGDFETTTLTSPGFVAGNLPGWNAAPFDYLWFPGTADQYPNPSANWGPGTGVPNGLPATSPTGGNFIEQDPYFNGSLTQVINGLTPSATYTLSFDWAAATWTGALLAPTSRDWQVSLGSQTYQTSVVTLGPQGFSGWMHETFTFTPTRGSELLSFMSQGTGDPPVAFLDGVSLVQSDVPETSTWALILCGVGFAGAVLRHRRKAVTA